MSHTEDQRVTYYSGHVIEVNGKRYINQRTCHDVSEADEVFRCSSCNNSLSVEYGDSRLFKNDFLFDSFDFCPFCGARVS